MEYLPQVKALALGWPYASSIILLALVYQAMSKYVYDEQYYRVGGTLWLVQIWLFAYFPKLLGQDPTSFKTLGFHALCSLCIMPSDDLMSFFLGFADQALLHLFLRPDFIPFLAWNQTLASPKSYSHDFEGSMVFTSTTCRVLLSRGCFAFSASLSTSLVGLRPYLLCL